MVTINIDINAGVKEPIKILHITDIHLALADGDDTLNLTESGEKRREVFRKEANYPEKTPSEYFAEAMKYGRDNCDLTVITGDVFDFISKANFAESDRILNGYDYMFTAGNHEFCPKIGVHICFSLRKTLYSDIQAHFKGDMHFEHRIINDSLNVVTMDNSLNFFDDEQCERFEDVLKNDLPTIAFFHVPLDDDYLCRRKFDPALIPTPEMDSSTDRMIGIMKKYDNYIAGFAGHWHGYRDMKIVDGKPEYLMAGTFKGIAGEICIK